MVDVEAGVDKRSGFIHVRKEIETTVCRPNPPFVRGDLQPLGGVDQVLFHKLGMSTLGISLVDMGAKSVVEREEPGPV